MLQSSATRTLHVQISTVVFLFRYQLRTALSVGLGMAQIGEFAFVLLSSASQHNLIPYQLYMLLMGAPAHPRKVYLLVSALTADLYPNSCALGTNAGASVLQWGSRGFMT